MNRAAKETRKGFSALIVIVLVVVIGAVLYFVNQGNFKKQIPESGLGDLPPAEERNNPLPLSANSLLVDDVDPGTKVVIKEATLGASAYILVQKETKSGGKTTVGKSELLNSGTHSGVSITTSQLNDADVIYIMVQEANGLMAKDDNGNTIEVQKNVGMLAGHEMAHDYY